ncbi:ATP-binding cassette domain-containing protein [bacterium]|nr:ATP-binding cassette domain-containing protein [bacterium]
MAAMIEIKSLRKEFGSFVAVDGVSFNVARGEVLGFLGPNGAGKSTTMKMITGFLAPTSGTAVVCGHDILRDPMKVKAAIGYLPEGAPAYPEMTPWSFLNFIGQIRGFRGADLRRRVDEAVQKTSLDSHLYVPIESLSKGYKRRVGLAQAIIHNPEVLIMDEPTDGLDPNQKHEVRKLIGEMAKDKAIILSTHILEEVEAICTRAVIIAAGKVIADGTPAQLAARSDRHNNITLRVQSRTAGNFKDHVSSVSGVSEVLMVREHDGVATWRIVPKSGAALITQVGALARQNNWEVLEIRLEQGRLDEVFRDLTADATAKAGREN